MFSSILPLETGIYNITLEAGTSLTQHTRTRIHHTHTYVIFCRIMVILLDFVHSTAV